MDLNYTESERQFRNELRAWLESNIPHDWRLRTGNGYLVEEPFAHFRAWQKKAHQGGWAGVARPREYGGRGAIVIEQLIVHLYYRRAKAPEIAFGDARFPGEPTARAVIGTQAAQELALGVSRNI
jgi:acyl-CoA dehydrogenase